MRVLIADDQEFIRRGLRALLLESADIEVCGEALDGREALLKAQQLQPDVVIMDVSMPRLDGLKATRELRSLLPNVQILTLSQYDIPEVRREALKAGAVIHVSKTAVWTTLIPALRRLARPPEEFDASRSTPETPQGESAADAIPRDSDEHFRSTFEQTAVGIAHVSEDGRWLRVNQKFCDLLGYTKQQIHELNFRDLTHPLDVATQLSQAQQMADGLLDHYSLRKRYIRKDGHSVWVQLTVDAVRDSQRRLKYCVHVAQEGRAALHDHSAQEKLLQAQRDLQIATTYLEMFTNRLSAPLSQYSRDLRYLWVNDNYARWLQRPPDQIIGRPILDVIGKDALDALLPHIDKVLSGHKIAFQQEADFHGIGPRRIAAFYAPTVDTTGAVDGWVALVQEIALSAFVRAN